MIHEVYPVFRMTVAGNRVVLNGPVRIAGYSVEAIGANATLKFYLNNVSAANQIWPEEHILGDGTKPVNFIGDLGTDNDKESIIIVPGGGSSIFYIRAHYKSRIVLAQASTQDISVIATGDDLHHISSPDSLDNSTINILIGKNGPTVTADLSLRFLNVNLPPGAVVTASHVTLTSVDTRSSGSPLAAFRTDNLDTDPQLIDDSDWHSRIADLMAEQIPWALPATTAGMTYQSPDLSPLIQAKIDRPGWLNNNDINLYLLEDGGTTGGGDFRGFEPYTGVGDEAVLHIEARTP